MFRKMRQVVNSAELEQLGQEIWAAKQKRMRKAGLSSEHKLASVAGQASARLGHQAKSKNEK